MAFPKTEETIPAFTLIEMDLTSDFCLKASGLPIIGPYDISIANQQN